MRDVFFFYFSDKTSKIVELNCIKTLLSRSKIPYNLNEVLIQTLKSPCLQRTQENCRYCWENNDCELSAKFSFIQSKLSPIDNSIHERVSFNMYHMRGRLRGKKQNLEEITFFFIVWNGKYGMLNIPMFLFAREIILSLNKFTLLL